jgi:hypothetical protein
MAKGYTSETELENYLLTDIASWFSSQITSWIEVVEKYIDNFTNRNFKADTVASEKLYDGDGSNSLLIDDCVEITKLEIDEEEYKEVDEDFYSYPANDECKDEIQLPSAVFTEGYQNVAITAKWGFSATVPSDIEFAATVLLAGIINQSLPHEGEVQSMAVGSFQVSYKTEQQQSDYDKAIKILESYKKFTF